MTVFQLTISVHIAACLSVILCNPHYEGPIPHPQSSKMIECQPRTGHINISSITVTYTGLLAVTCGDNSTSGCGWSSLPRSDPFLIQTILKCTNKISCEVNAEDLYSHRDYPPCGKDNSQARDTAIVNYLCTEKIININQTTPVFSTSSTSAFTSMGKQTMQSASTATTVKGTADTRNSRTNTARPTQRSVSESDPTGPSIRPSILAVIIVCAVVFLILVILAIVLAVRIHMIQRIKADISSEAATPL